MNKTTATLVVLAVSVWGAVSASGFNLLENGDFSLANADGTPAGWEFSLSNQAQARMQIAPGAGHDGPNALKITNGTALRPHVFGRLAQAAPLVKNGTYEISLWARGKGTAERSAMLILGKSWSERFLIEGISGDWKRYVYRFTAKADEFAAAGRYLIALNTDDITEELFISDLTLVPLNTLFPVTAVGRQGEGVWMVPKLPGFSTSLQAIPEGLQVITFPRSPSQRVPAESGPASAQDLACETALGYDEKGVIVLVRVHDDRHVALYGEGLWRYDAIQIAIDPNADFNVQKDAMDIELGFSVHQGQVRNWCWSLGRELTGEEVECGGRELPDGYFIVARLTWSILNKLNPQGKGAFGFNIIVNDNDEGTTRKLVFLAPGIHEVKSNADNLLCLFENSGRRAVMIPDRDDGVVTDSLAFRLILPPDTAALPDGLNLLLAAADGTTASFPVGVHEPLRQNQIAMAKFRIDAKKLAPGPLRVKLGKGADSWAEFACQKRDFVREFTAALPKAQKQFLVLSQEADRQEAVTPLTWRVKAIRAIASRQFALLEADAAKTGAPEEREYYGKRGMQILGELDELRNAMHEELGAIKQGHAKPREFFYASSRRILKNGYLEADTLGPKGNTVRRPVIFSGYGHFGLTIDDLSYFPSLGNNVIQVEIGPSSIVLGEREDGSFIIDTGVVEKWILPALERAWQHNMTVTLLLSPHYFPAWALQKHPEVKREIGACINFEIHDPYSLKLMEAYLKAVIPLLKNARGAGALHSLCLSNESNYSASLKQPFTRKRYQAFLEKNYGTVAKLNAVYGTAYADFAAAVPTQDPAAGGKPVGAFHDFTRFKMDECAQWHAWMASTIKGIWPEVPLYAKEMIWDVWMPANLIANSAEPERFSAFSDLNGNDNCFIYDRTEWGADWVTASICGALQTSIKPVAIVNAENHIIADGVTGPVPYDFVYTSIFQQFMHGVGTSAAWVWENYDYAAYLNKSVFVGDLYRRPTGILAVSDASVDANRLSCDIRDFVMAKPEVAMLYSLASNIADPAYSQQTKYLFTALSFSGWKVGFVTEAQAQRGQFGACKVLFLGGASVVERKTAAALAAFVRNGGRIFTYGNCLERDPYGQPLAFGFPTLPVNTEERGTRLAGTLRQILEQTLGAQPARLAAAEPDGMYGVEWRVIAPKPGEQLINACNYNAAAKEVSLVMPANMNAVELISGRPCRGKLTLERFKPVLIRVSIAD